DDVSLTKYSHGGYVTPFPSEKAIHMHRWNNGTGLHAWAKNGSSPGIYTLDGYGGWPSLARIGHGQDFCHCNIGAIRVYNYALTDPEVAVVMDELNTKYP